MRRFVDLHLHSTASDGTIRPSDIIVAADTENLAAIALCDHDTVGGLQEAEQEASKYPDLRFIRGVEISAVCTSKPRGTLHILGLGIDPDARGLSAILGRLRKAREQRNPKMLAKLAELGVDLTMEEVMQCVPGTHEEETRVVSRVHIAEALVRRGLVSSIGEAFNKYIAPGAPAWVNKERIQASEAIAAIRESGGMAVLAHPAQLRCQNAAELERMVRTWISAGLNGIECYHPVHDARQTRLCLDLARKHNLAVTGGSDFHGRSSPSVKMGIPRVPVDVIPQKLLE